MSTIGKIAACIMVAIVLALDIAMLSAVGGMWGKVSFECCIAVKESK